MRRDIAIPLLLCTFILLGCASRPWTFTVLPGERPMILRIRTDGVDREWLLPDWTVPNADAGIVLDVPARAEGSIALIDPRTCKAVAHVDLPNTGPGVLVTYWQTYSEDMLMWQVEAAVDTMLAEPTAALSGTAPCLVGT